MNLKFSRLSGIALGTAGLGCILRLALYQVGFDHRHILTAAHPLHLVCLAITLALGAYLLWAVRNPEETGDLTVHFPGASRRFLWGLTAAGLMVCQGISLTRETDSLLFFARACLTFSAAVAMALTVLGCSCLRRMHLVCRGLICVFFALDMLCRYQDWSGNPQLPDYLFQVPACVLLCLTCYHRLALDTGLSGRRVLLWCSLMAMYLCLLCVSGPDDRMFYLSGALWAGCCLVITDPTEEMGGQADVPA